MNRLNHTALRRLSPRFSVITGTALGLVAGAALYGSISSSAEVPQAVAFTVVKPRVVAAAPAPAPVPARLAACGVSSKLEKGVCVVRVVRRVVVPSPALAAAPSASAGTAAAPSASAGTTAASMRPASVSGPAKVAKPAAVAPRGDQAATRTASETHSTSADGAQDAASSAQLSPTEAADLAAKNKAALAARDAAAPGARSTVQD